MLSGFDQQIVRALAPWADIAGEILLSLAQRTHSGPFGESTLCREAGLPSTKTLATVRILKELAKQHLVKERDDARWEVTTTPDTLKRYAPLLSAIGFYQTSVHEDVTTASVVLTRPGEPSKIEEALREVGFATSRMEITAEAFGDIAASAAKRLVVMTPFLDEHGAKWLIELLKKTKADVQRTVVLRYLHDTAHPSYPTGYDTLIGVLGDMSVSVVNYAVPRNSGYGIETFHAKVVLADDSYAYVGSANMNRASLEYSMELGITVRGEAARTVARILDAIIRISSTGY